MLGRNDLPFEEMVKLDYLYVTNWSLWWDIKILCQTVPVVLRRKGVLMAISVRAPEGGLAAVPALTTAFVVPAFNEADNILRLSRTSSNIPTSSGLTAAC